jgi:hypothetical protein
VMKDQMPLHRLAQVMRTSVKMLTETYGWPSDESNINALDVAFQPAWGDDPQAPLPQQ